MKNAAKPRRREAAPAVQPIATAERGEDELTLAGTTYLLRPSHKALKAIEKQTGRALLALVRLGNTGELTLEQMGIITAHLIRAGAEDELTRNVGAERLAELIQEEGLGVAMSRLTFLLLDASTGGRDVSGNVKAAVA